MHATVVVARQMTLQVSQIPNLISRIGDVALDPSLWPAVMEDISCAVGATGAALLQADVRTPDIPRTASVNDLFDAYFNGSWHVRDIRARGAPLLVSGKKSVISDQDVVTEDEMKGGSYYNELLRPFGLRWFSAVGFRAGTAHWALSIHRSAREGPFEDIEVRLLEQLSSKLTEAASLSSAVGQAVLSGVGNALDLCGQAALFLDRWGFVLDNNAAADRLFDNEICHRNRQLIVGDPKAKLDLNKLISWLRSASERATPPVRTIIVHRRIGRPVLIRVLPIPPAARSPVLGARVMLTLSVLKPSTGTSPTLLIRTFDLSPAEANIAALIGDGATLDEAARASGVALSTARNQLKATFAKTGTHRQSELVALTSILKTPDSGR